MAGEWGERDRSRLRWSLQLLSQQEGIWRPNLRSVADRKFTSVAELMRRYREALEALDPDDRAAFLRRRPAMTMEESVFLEDYAEFMNGGIDYERRQRVADSLYRPRGSIEPPDS